MNYQLDLPGLHC